MQVTGPAHGVDPRRALPGMDRPARAFVEDVTHQIRTPLTTLVTHAHLIQATARQIPLHAEYAEVIGRILESAAAIQESADRLARDVREMARSTRIKGP